MDPIIESFSYITSASGKKYQVLRFRLNEETGEQEPYDSDVAAAAELAAKHEPETKE